MSSDYRPEVGDTVKVEVEVEAVGAFDGSLTLKATGHALGKILTDPAQKVELVKRKAPALKYGDVVQGEYGTWVIGRDRVTYTSARNGGSTASSHGAESLAQAVTSHPETYTLIKHKENK